MATFLYLKLARFNGPWLTSYRKGESYAADGSRYLGVLPIPNSTAKNEIVPFDKHSVVPYTYLRASLPGSLLPCGRVRSIQCLPGVRSRRADPQDSSSSMAQRHLFKMQKRVSCLC